MPRALWSGSLAFGLVNAPVRLYSAIDEHELDLHLVHRKDGSRIGYQKVCKAEGKPVPNDEIVKAYEVDGELVLLEPEDFEAAESEGYKTIEILSFASWDEIDPIYFERSFFLGPQQGSEKVYALLVEAMEQSRLAGVVRFVFHDREQLGLLRVREGTLVLARMHFADEIRPDDEIRPERRPKVEKAELEMALDLVDRYRDAFDPAAYEDRYRERLLEIVEQKRKGGETRAVEREERRETPDLVAALKESIERASRGRQRNGRPEAEALEALTVEELTERARKLDIEGRSRMSKAELVDAVGQAEQTEANR